MVHRSCFALSKASCLLAALLLMAAPVSFAKSHLWRFTEIFSNADRSVQFIEMFVFDPAGTDEIRFGGRPLTSNANTFIFPSDLADENTFGRYVLIATQSFADLPGAPAPDYILPPGFFDPEGDLISYRGTIDQVPIGAGAMPVDGVTSLKQNNDHELYTELNDPTNFAGVSGRIAVGSGIFVDGFE